MVSLNNKLYQPTKEQTIHWKPLLSIYSEKGVTMSEIADLIEKMYGHHYTPQTMSNMTKVLE